MSTDDMTRHENNHLALDDKTILVTGGTGSFGQTFVDAVLQEYIPHAIRIYSRGELLQSEMASRFQSDRLRFIIGDVRDRNGLHRAMYGSDILVHAAALKQVPTAEYNPAETVATNVMGAINVIDAAIDAGVDKILAIGTDKQVHPINLYGATKLVAEKLFVQANIFVGNRNTKISSVRYGNVLGSRGSVVPLFRKQRKEGEVTVTSDQMTRFWFTVEQGVQFVIDCLGRMRGGEVFIPKIPSMRLIDLVRVIAPDAKIKVIGLRPGEKMHEVLISGEESSHVLDFGDYFVVLPELSVGWDINKSGGKTLPHSYQYSSDTNLRWLTMEEMAELIGENG